MKIEKQIEVLKTRLNDLIEKKEANLLDPEIIQFSQELDELIVRAQRKFSIKGIEDSRMKQVGSF